MTTARLVVAIAVALALQTTLVRFAVAGGSVVDLVLVVVVYTALVSGPVRGLLTGAIAGIAQDTLSGGIVGVGGLAKTMVGFLAGIVGSQFIVVRPMPRFVVFVLATLAHAFCFLGLHMLLDPRAPAWPFAAVLGQAVGNALVGVLAFQANEMLPGVIQRRRVRGTQLSRRRL